MPLLCQFWDHNAPTHALLRWNLAWLITPKWPHEKLKYRCMHYVRPAGINSQQWLLNYWLLCISVLNSSAFTPNIVRCVMGDSKRDCANWSKSMKFGTLIDFHMLYPNLPGAKANSQWCHHLARFKMAACQKQIFPLCVKEMLNNYK